MNLLQEFECNFQLVELEVNLFLSIFYHFQYLQNFSSALQVILEMCHLDDTSCFSLKEEKKWSDVSKVGQTLLDHFYSFAC